VKEYPKNLLVAVFVLVALACIGWMLFQFRDLPAKFSRYKAHVVTIFFPRVPGVEANTPVYFLGYPVGRVLEVRPPAPAPSTPGGASDQYQVSVDVAIDESYAIPGNVNPKVFMRGLGGSYLELVLVESDEPAGMLTDGDKLIGSISGGSEFISEETQASMDKLITTVTKLGDTLQGQLVTIPPDQVDPEKNIFPNVTTAVMRLDQALQNLNFVLADKENQANLKVGIQTFADVSQDIQMAVKESHKLMVDARALVQESSEAVRDLKGTYVDVGLKVRDTADSLGSALTEMSRLMHQVNQGKGTAGKILKDPRLYESLTETGENLSLAVKEFRDLIANLNEHGIIGYKGKDE
jgi:phospholipid/cholesterol/gamma-HCH transport system substrate-binding protein